MLDEWYSRFLFFLAYNFVFAPNFPSSKKLLSPHASHVTTRTPTLRVPLVGSTTATANVRVRVNLSVSNVRQTHASVAVALFG